MSVLVRNFYIGKLLRRLLFICTLQRSLVTSQILALSEVKAIIVSGHYVTHLVTCLLLPTVARVVIPEFGCMPPGPAPYSEAHLRLFGGGKVSDKNFGNHISTI